MTLEDFKKWVKTLPEPPEKTLWWELKARLDSVTETTSLTPSQGPLPALEIAPEAPPAEADIVDWPPPVAEEDWRGDGGVSAEAVRALRRQQKRSFSLPEAENRP